MRSLFPYVAPVVDLDINSPLVSKRCSYLKSKIILIENTSSGV